MKKMISIFVLVGLPAFVAAGGGHTDINGHNGEHAGMMLKMPAMTHADPNMIPLVAGQQGELVWQFTRPGEFDFACLVPGHLEAGMTGKISVN